MKAVTDQQTTPTGQPRTWTLHAGVRANDDGTESFVDIDAHPQFAREYGHQPVAVTATEDPDGDYYGWIQRGEDTPVMVYDHPGLFSMCFPYGPKAEVEAGTGEIVRLRLVLVAD